MKSKHKSMKQFVNLHVHSHYSLLDGLAKISGLVKLAQEHEMSTLAITDHGALYGAIEFYQLTKKAGIKPIIGVETYITSRGRFRKETKADDERFHLILLAKNFQGYKNLLKIVTASYLEGFYYRPRVDFELLQEFHEGILATSSCINGQIGQAILSGGDPKPIVQRYLDIFGDSFYLEVQHHPSLVEQQTVNDALVELSRTYSVPLVATGDSHYLQSQDAQAHDVLLCLQTKKVKTDTNRMCMLGEDFSFANYQHIIDAFSEKLPQAIENTIKIAEMCELEIPMGKTILPHFELPKGETAEKKLRDLCQEGIVTRYGDNPSPKVFERLEYELGVINSSGYPSYFLIVHDFVSFAKKQKIVVGPGRGSAAGSIVAYLLHITNLDPLAYDLLFERFLNPERVTMPDIDLDFADSRRDDVIDYVEEKYGKDHVAHIITFGTMAARVSIRDVGRVLGVSYSYCDSLAKMIPPHMELAECVEKIPELREKYEKEEDTKNIIDIAKKLEGVARHSSTHACGIVITKDPLTDYAPCQYASPDDKTIVTQYSLHPVEDLGLLKFDFLGLSNLTILEQAKKIIQKTRGVDIDLDTLPLNDKKTYTLFQKGKTTGVFQFESAGMKRYLKELKPSEFEDVIAMVALYRPGPMDLIPDYIASKHGKRIPEYIHERLRPILENTYGIAIYQEQLMKIAQELAGFSLGEADVLRKAVGKKIPKLLKEQREKFVQGCISQEVKKQIAEKVFDFIEPFAGYGFNRSHAACYAFIGYQTAYMKAHYPTEFMAALLTADQQNTDRVAIEIEECREMGIEVLAPDINESFEGFTAVMSLEKESSRIRFGLLAIKNVGEHIVDVLVEERKKNGHYTSLEDLLTRVQDKDLNKKSLESLIKSGSLDSFGDRNEMLYNSDALLSFHKRVSEQLNTRQASIFGGNSASVKQTITLAKAPPLENQQKLLWEKELLGLYISQHPLTELDSLLSPYVQTRFQVQKSREGALVKVYGIVTTIKKILTKKNEPMIFVKLEDLSGTLEIIVFPSLYQEQVALWKEDAILLCEGKVSFKDNECKILASRTRAVDSQFIEMLKAKLPQGTQAPAQQKNEINDEQEPFLDEQEFTEEVEMTNYSY